jgi:rsbT co-antagonist protein RsbR
VVTRSATRIPDLVRKHEADVLADWIKEQLGAPTLRSDLTTAADLREECRRFLRLFAEAVQRNADDVTADAWNEVRDALGELSRRRARAGFSPSETATFVFSLKRPLFTRLREDVGRDAEALADEVWRLTVLLDTLGLYTTEVHQKGREEVLVRQQQEMLELSTPVVQLWEGILALPLIGTLDSARTQVVMENLLQKIVATGAGIAIIDITGVPTVDTLVAQHLLKTVAAARLMGADCIISGIRPQIAQTIVHLGVDLGNVITKATLADAFAIALAKAGTSLTRALPRA